MCAPRVLLTMKHNITHSQRGSLTQMSGDWLVGSPNTPRQSASSRPLSGSIAATGQETPTSLPIVREKIAIPGADHVAIVHDWCPSFRGGERVLSSLCDVFGVKNIYTLFDFLEPDVKKTYFKGVSFHTSPANCLPNIKRFYRALFFVCPFLIEQFDVTGYDAVISSSAAFARGVITRPDQAHLCYVHSPVRYAWDEQFSYLEQARLGYGLRGIFFRYLLHNLRTWDARTAHGPDLMVANSTYVRGRIRRIYGRDLLVIFPPVAVGELPFESEKEDYYVAASFLAPYKRTDLVIRAFNEMPSRRLLVMGEGQQSAALRNLAGPNVTFTGFLPRTDYVRTLAQAKAMVFAGCEDFGIALAEAQCCGTPVIAFGRGGACDIVRPAGGTEPPTGVLFQRQTVAAVKDAVEAFATSAKPVSPFACRQNAHRFSEERFAREISAAFDATLAVCAASWH